MGFEGIVDRFVFSANEFDKLLSTVRPDQWTSPTPCTEWNIHQLVNHLARGNLNYVFLLDGGSAAEFRRLRDADALGSDPLGSYRRTVQECADAFARPGVLDRVLDHTLGPLPADRALALRTADSMIHTWDLARAIGADETLNSDLVTWLDENLTDIFAGLSESPFDPQTTHRFFAAPSDPLPPAATRQHRLLHLMGRRP